MERPKVLVVTGASAGIGFAIASRWVREGGVAVSLDLRGPEHSSAVQHIECDVSERDSVFDAMAAVRARCGEVHALVNAAGIMRPEPSVTASEETVTATLATHFHGTLWACQAAHESLSAMAGAIVNFSSVAGISGMPDRVAYNGAKAAIDALTRTLAVEWAPAGIRVNAVAPGYTRTRMTGDLIAAGKLREQPIIERTPLRRFADPDEIAAPTLFLLSDQASYITGQTLYVDGGMTVDGNWY